MSDVVLQEASVADVPFMQQMLYVATIPEYIPLEYRPPFEKLMSANWVSRYITGWGREHDHGLVAFEEGVALGATWYRKFKDTEMQQLQKLTDVALPPFELAIGLTEGARGRRIGSTLLGKLLDDADERGVNQMCLSVSVENPVARRLYKNSGFDEVGGNSKSRIMLRTTGPF